MEQVAMDFYVPSIKMGMKSMAKIDALDAHLY
jgi:hypothetical protein